MTGEVNNHVTTAQGQQLSYLHIKWAWPGVQQTGEYTCTVSAVRESGRDVTFNISLHVTRQDLSLPELAAEMLELKRNNTELQSSMAAHQQTNVLLQAIIGDLQSKMAAQQQAIDLHHSTMDILQSNIASQQTTIRDLQQKNDLQNTTISDLLSKITAQDSDIATLQSLGAELGHVETGLLRCGGSDSWSHRSSRPGYHGCYGKQKQMTATFKQNYSKPPVVFLSTSYLYIYGDRSHNLGTQLLSVSKASFSMRCGTHPSDDVADLEVRWIAVPA